ncbi:MAG: hypothetical protein ACJAS4_001561 [Bacteriovoracaceae bacterium]|jgi:hypothetical protein
MKTKLLLFFLSFTVFFGCRPEQAVTSFNVLIEVPIGESLTLYTDEDTSLQINYNVIGNEESVDLKLNVSGQPKHGVLTNCKELSTSDFNCTYTPNENFSGIDHIEFMTSDGELVAQEASVITIEVNEVADAPIALDYTFMAKAGNTIRVDLPKGIDSDSLTSELSYTILKDPTRGLISNCVDRQCQYTSTEYFNGSDSFNYQIVDESGKVSNIATITVEITNDILAGVETFTQGVTTYDGVDIVWVIDNSGSMSNEQAALKANFTAFIDNFLVNGKAKFPFNMAITTTDNYNLSSGSNPFRLNASGNMYDLSSTRAETDFANFKADFEEGVLVGINGSGDERVFQSMDNSYALNSNWFGGNNRLLTYIVLSDESEHSGGLVQDWANKFFALKDKNEKVSVFPIINPNADSGSRYEQIASLTGSKVYDINQSFQPILDDISLSVSQNISSYPLNPALDIIEGTISVAIDGVDTPFTYSNKSIQLASPPAPYATIVVKYNYNNTGY